MDAPGNAFWDSNFFSVWHRAFVLLFVMSYSVWSNCSVVGVIIGHSTEAFQGTSITGKTDNLIEFCGDQVNGAFYWITPVYNHLPGREECVRR